MSFKQTKTEGYGVTFLSNYGKMLHVESIFLINNVCCHFLNLECAFLGYTVSSLCLAWHSLRWTHVATKRTAGKNLKTYISIVRKEGIEDLHSAWERVVGWRRLLHTQTHTQQCCSLHSAPVNQERQGENQERVDFIKRGGERQRDLLCLVSPFYYDRG